MATTKKAPAKAKATTAKKAPAKATAKKAPFTKQNGAVRTAEEKMSAKDNVLKRIGKRIGSTKEQSEMILNAVVASIQEATVIKGTLNLPVFAKFESVAKAESTGTIQFGDRKGESWVKPAHQAIKVSNINGVWLERANDETEVIAIDDIEEIWGGEAEEADDADDVEDTEEEEAEAEAEEEAEEEPAPKKAPAKKAPAKKATPAKKAPAKKPTAKK